MYTAPFRFVTHSDLNQHFFSYLNDLCYISCNDSFINYTNAHLKKICVHHYGRHNRLQVTSLITAPHYFLSHGLNLELISLSRLIGWIMSFLRIHLSLGPSTEVTDTNYCLAFTRVLQIQIQVLMFVPQVFQSLLGQLFSPTFL